MALSGDLKDFGLLQLLTLVQVTDKTGALTMERLGESATVYFENGQLTKVKTRNSRSYNLVPALHQAGRINREQLELVGPQALPSEKTAGLLLVDQGILTQEEIVDFVRDGTVADVYTLLTWSDGTFRLEVDAFPPEDDILTPTDLAPILEEGRTYLSEWQLLASHIPDLDRPLRLLPEPRQQQDEVTLGLAEWRMVANLVGSITLRDAAQRLGLNEFAVRRVAYRLISAGLADVEQPANVMPPAPMEDEGETEQPKAGGISWLFGQRRK